MGGHRKLTVNDWESLDYYRTLKRSGKFNCDTAKFSDLLPPPPQMKFWKKWWGLNRGTTPATQDKRCFFLFLFLGAVGTEIRTECINDEIRLSNPQLASLIQENSYKELIWTVDDPEEQGQDKQKLVYCNEYPKCHKYNITGRYKNRIETTAAVRGVLYIKQKKFNDKLTYTCRVIQKGNKPPCDYTITVRSSANCE